MRFRAPLHTGTLHPLTTTGTEAKTARRDDEPNIRPPRLLPALREASISSPPKTAAAHFTRSQASRPSLINLDDVLPTTWTASAAACDAGITTPSFFLTARDDMRDHQGLTVGGDVTRHQAFGLERVVAHIRAITTFTHKVAEEERRLPAPRY